MSDSENAGAIASVAGLAKALMPSCVKALDRLVGSAIDVPMAWLQQQKAKIDGQTKSFELVESRIADTAALEAGSDPATVQRAMGVLIRKEYRKQQNRDAVAKFMIEALADGKGEEIPQEIPPIDDGWLNVFERYAEDASAERMQELWGRVIAGEVRRPGRYSLRTLRFLSEFSQNDAVAFEEISSNFFGDAAPRGLLNPPENKDISNLVYLASIGLLAGATGLGLVRTISFDEQGLAFIEDSGVCLMLQGVPSTSFDVRIIKLSAIGRELLSLIPGRDHLESARRFALAYRCDEISAAYLGFVDSSRKFLPNETLWES